MRTSKARKISLLVGMAGTLFIGASGVQAVDIAASASGTTLTVTLTPGAGEAVVASRNDLVFEGAIVPEILDPATALSADLSADAGELMVVDPTDLPDFGVVTIEGERIAYERKDGDTLIVASDREGSVTGRGQDGTTAAAHSSGATVEVPTALPDCAPIGALSDAGKTAVFFFLPVGCTPGVGGDCLGVRAIVVALDNFSELTSETDLYACTVAGEAAGFLTCPDVTTPATEPFLPAQSSRSPFASGDGLLPTMCSFVRPPMCAGDCDGDGETTLGEVQKTFNLFLGTVSFDECPVIVDEGLEITLGYVQKAFNTYLGVIPCDP